MNIKKCIFIKNAFHFIKTFGYFGLNGKTLASASEDRTVKLWNIQTGECCQTLSGHQSLVWSVAFIPQNQVLASSSID